MSDTAYFTASNWPTVKPGHINELRAVIDNYNLPNGIAKATQSLQATVHDGTDKHSSEDKPYLKIQGGAAFDPSKPLKAKDGAIINYENGHAEEFLKDIAPHLEEQLIVRSIGHNNLEFPCLAVQWSVWPDGTTRYDNFDNTPDKPTTND